MGVLVLILVLQLPGISCDFLGFPGISWDFLGFPVISWGFLGISRASVGAGASDWIGLDWIGLVLDWIGLDWIGLNWIGLDWIGIGLDWIGLVLVLVLEFATSRNDSLRVVTSLIGFFYFATKRIGIGIGNVV